MTTIHPALGLACVLALTGCDSADLMGGRSGSNDAGWPTDAAPVDAGPSPVRPPVEPSPDPSLTECATSSHQAESVIEPVDVIWVIDSSGSMDEEAQQVQSNVNAFAAAIGAATIDYRVVMLSPTSFVQVPDPLGSDAARFLHVDEHVDSEDPLIDALGRFDDYAPMLRPDAATHFVIVTDDDSDLSASAFQADMEARLGHPFTLHAIASPPGSENCGFFDCDDGCEGPSGEAADNGDEYWSIANTTEGQRLSICADDWTGLFAELTAAIAVRTELPCRYALPTPPAGETLDRGRVNFVYEPGVGGEAIVVPNVGDAGACAASGGWYYEGDSLVACPSSCEALRADESGSVAIALGCATELI